MDDDRRRDVGRRDYDGGTEWILRRFDRLEDRLTREIEKVEDELDEACKKLDTRIDDLELFRTEETTEARLKLVQHTRQLETVQRRQIRIANAIALLSFLVTIAEHFLHL